MQPLRPVEVLAPAGSEECLIAAVRSGADAVYLGGKYLNARRSASNFDGEELRGVVSYCHARGVKIYLTLNTLIFDSEFPLLAESLSEACRAGVDAVLVQDLAAAAFVRQAAPSLALHASTQMSVHNLDGAKMLEQMGFSRVVLAREMSREEIGRVVAGTALSAEVFVHGALCMSVSGQCTLSSMIGGRSGNRGLCAQPCRLPFACKGNSHALSLRDLTLLPHVAGLREMGVAAFKIEGRMKRPEYVAAAVTACRRALRSETPDYAALEAVFSRGGFTQGYYAARRDKSMFGIRRKEDVTAAAPVLKKLASLYREERKAVPVALELIVRRGSPTTLSATDADSHTARVSGSLPETAVTSPTTAEKAEVNLRKTGGTYYTVRDIACKIDDGLLVPAAELNALRREALARLSEQREAVAPHMFDPSGTACSAPPHRVAERPELRVRLGRARQLSRELIDGAERVILPVTEWTRADKDLLCACSDKLLPELPRIRFDNGDGLRDILLEAKRFGVTRLTVGDLGGLALAKRYGFLPHGDYGLNIANTRALAEYAGLGLADATLSFELSAVRIRHIGGCLPRGILAYGHFPLMALRNCPHAAHSGCKDCGRAFPALTDRKGNCFFLDCQDRVATLHNCVPVDLADRLRDFPAIDFFTLYFTRETAEECAAVLRRYRTGSDTDRPKTRGLYYREVL